MRDYSMRGEDGRRAVALGLTAATWWKPAVERSRMKQLMQRRNGPAVRDTAIWIGLLILFGTLGVILWFSWLSLVCFAVYGVLYGSASDSRWHECGHGTAFRTRWMNDAVYQLACFMVMRDPTVWRWSHVRHHTDTIIVGRDPEVLFTRPPNLTKLAINVVGLVDVPLSLRALLVHVTGRLTADEQTFVPETEWRKTYRTARITLAIYLATVAACVASRSVLPAMVIGLPRLYGCWHMVMTGWMQHGGLAEDVNDHRLNSRTVTMNPLSRFVYWNMNYHLEHHLFPMVPFHALPALHAEIGDQLPAPSTGWVDALGDIVPTVLRQRRDPTYVIARHLKDGTLLSPSAPAVGAGA
jgi:fatty acid desaturase